MIMLKTHLPSEILNQVGQLTEDELFELILNHYPKMYQVIARAIAIRLKETYKKV